MEAESRFHIGEKASKSCQQDFNKLRQHLSINQTSWAVRMFESSEWPRVGLLSGKKYHLGSWTECVNTDAKTFKGQYCLVEAKFDFSHLEKPRAVGMESSAWNDLQQFHEDPHQLVHLHHVYWAMCIPSSCQPSDLELSMKNIVDVVFTDYNDVAVKVKVNPKMCSVKTDDKVSFSFNLIA
ncbi:hypothetical protein V9T40_009614 [Parthenolecanium corni]|uniref:Nose resistant-to-fluoxetine protein N-terminal domain-containing protein n=1 Tax=Parthenolecanium corni TaxID=536013 RepID=A0AAN9TQB1_9HEMI